MRTYFSRALFLLSLFGAVSSPTRAQFVFKCTDFSQTSEVVLEENSYRRQKIVVLTAPEAGLKGGLWLSKKVKVRNGFSTSFVFRMQNGGTTMGGFEKGADGIAFVIHNNPSPTGVGNQGGGIGYDGVPNSIAIELDNWQNGEWGDPNDNHIAIHTLGTEANSSASTAMVAVNTDLPSQLEDGKLHRIEIDYEKGVLKVSMDKQVVLTKTIDIGKTLNLDNETAWVGFTASTGAAFASQEIHEWDFKGDLPPPAVKEKPPVVIGDRPVITGKKVIKVHSPKITLEVWDKGIEDGDIISLNFNNQWILENYPLKKTKKLIEIDLREEHNLLVLHALNLGRIPPNTVVLTVLEGNKRHQVLLNSNLKASDSVEIRYTPK